MSGVGAERLFQTASNPWFISTTIEPFHFSILVVIYTIKRRQSERQVIRMGQVNTTHANLVDCQQPDECSTRNTINSNIIVKNTFEPKWIFMEIQH